MILFQKFPGGGMPPDPPRRLVLCTAGCASHTRIVHLYLMAMQFQKWPIKFTFDWPFCPSNNFPLYCTLLSNCHFVIQVVKKKSNKYNLSLFINTITETCAPHHQTFNFIIKSDVLYKQSYNTLTRIVMYQCASTITKVVH